MEMQLPAKEDLYGGVVVEMKENMDPDVFHALLKTSKLQWKLQGKKGVWIKLPINLVNLVETAIKEGFWYHHAEPKFLMLADWLPETTSTLPGNATHIARVGAIVLNDKQEILVVQEKLGGKTEVWKISTGILKQGEDIHVGVVREVKEETGVSFKPLLCISIIDTEFVEVRAFSQEHDVFFGKSEVLFLCMMRPLSFDIQIQETEIKAAKWHKEHGINEFD
ncbi:NUDIX hydrolase, conserved site-containing protein, partial [Cynara cardunculus var. scolymus]